LVAGVYNVVSARNATRSRRQKYDEICWPCR
jgi:hypothetical protein